MHGLKRLKIHLTYATTLKRMINRCNDGLNEGHVGVTPNLILFFFIVLPKSGRRHLLGITTSATPNLIQLNLMFQQVSVDLFDVFSYGLLR